MTMSPLFTRWGASAALVFALAAPAAGQPIAITGGRVYPVSGPPIDNATVVIIDGKIAAVGPAVPPPAGARIIDAKGKWVTPGLINGATRLGLVEVGSLPSTNDATARGDRAVAAAFQAWEGLNWSSVLWAPTVNEGVTTVVSLPGGRLISGQAAVVDTAGATAAQQVRRAPAAMVANLGSPAVGETQARGELLMRFRELLDDARDYAARTSEYERAATREYATGRLHLEALQPVLAGKLLLVVAADRASDITNALEVAREYKLRLAILGGAEAWQVAGSLAAAKVPVLTTGLDNIPASFETLGARQENAAILRKAGVPVVITAGEGETFNVRNIKQHAGNAVAYGLTWDDALRAITLTPAEVFGIDATVGSLTVGKDANLVLWDGDPFEFATRAERVFIRGIEVQGASRQDLLTDRYKRGGR
ncbi:MAG: amidohydrolase family protein [Acidobacteria bacterium]|nr:amidohydrolase family protein [Acidobacteriota bacterium]